MNTKKIEVYKKIGFMGINMYVLHNIYVTYKYNIMYDFFFCFSQ